MRLPYTKGDKAPAKLNIDAIQEASSGVILSFRGLSSPPFISFSITGEGHAMAVPTAKLTVLAGKKKQVERKVWVTRVIFGKLGIVHILQIFGFQ